MEKIIEFRKYPLDMILDKLLLDKTTGKRIIWATDGYSEYGEKYCDRFEITSGALIGINPVLIQPRAFKALETQQQRTKSKAEVFTPSWIVNKMVNHLDEEWFGRSGVFNIEESQTWQTQTEKVNFEKKKWKDYVDRTILEITCGEAPFIVSRYNASTGEIIPIEDRIGILDRKLRVVTENTDNEKDWLKWAQRAFESVYGYEYQGDNLLIGRINLLMTFVDYYRHIWGKEVDKKLLTTITNIITWNFWQMDGLNGTVPLGVPQPIVEQMTLFDIDEEKEEKAPLCKVKQWRAKRTILYKEIEMKEGKDMGKKKWDIVIGNPPYNLDGSNTVDEGNKTFAPPIYPAFFDSAASIGKITEFITPARFLFNAGSTPKKWNEQMLNSEHFKVLNYCPNSSSVFPTTDIKGGVVISLVNENKKFTPIGIFTGDENLNAILSKVRSHPTFKSLENDVLSRTSYHLTKTLHEEHPEAKYQLSKGHLFDVSTNIFDRLPGIFLPSKPDDDQEYISVVGRSGNERTVRFIPRKYLNTVSNLYSYKVFTPSGSDGASILGNKPVSIFGPSMVAGPGEAATETFISVGNFKEKSEADSLLKYLKSKFVRALVAILKVTPNTTPEKFKYVPNQNFTATSDIDWSKPIPEIDQQLYKKYDLSPEEIDFIETHVKEME